MIIRALIGKEIRLVSRDPHALGALLLMPTLFILLMAFALSAVNEDKLPAIQVTTSIPTESENAHFFGLALNEQLGGDTRAKGAVPLIELAPDFDERLLDPDAEAVGIRYPASTDSATRQRLRAAVQTALAQTRTQAYLLGTGELSAEQPLEARLRDITDQTRVLVAEQDLTKDGPAQRANASQHSVPAWLIFGMFFVMLPMAHSFQHERQSGALMRLRCLELGTFPLVVSKLVPYLGLNLLQFATFLALGAWGLPLLGLPGLALTGDPLGYVALAISLALAACTLGLAISTLAGTAEQALLLSAGINIILAAIGGVMVPKSVMPDAMRHVAELSPMSWGLDAFLTLLVGHGDLAAVAPYCARLLGLAVVVGAAALVLFRRRLNDTQWTAHF